MATDQLKSKIFKLPKSPGVYEFRDKKGKILYIGKATSLRDRVRSYFRNFSKIGGAGSLRPQIAIMVPEIVDIRTRATDSVLEALILESNLIKKHQPKYNVEGKDDKSFAYVIITREKFPRVLIVRETDLEKLTQSKLGFSLTPIESGQFLKAKLFTKTFGPYTSRKQLEIALKLIRKIFPYHSAKQVSRNCCFEHQIGLCPGPHIGAISRKDYLKNIHGIEMILQGKKKKLLKVIKKQMREYSRKNEFEKAAEARNRIFALEHIRDVALISDESKHLMLGASNIKCLEKCRIEAYDISNIGGDFATGAMVVFVDDKPNKPQYRRFKIKTVKGANDIGMTREVLYRRFKNNWPKPDLILLDGGKGHLNMAERLLRNLKLKIPIVAVAKGPTRKKIDIYNTKTALAFHEIIGNNELVEQIRSEAHRFAISYHKKLRRKKWRDK